MNEIETQRWLRYATEDLTAAEKMLSGTDSFPRHACWLAQQAAEKALKAGLISCDQEFPFTHDLDRLRNLLPDNWQVKAKCPDLAELTEWAVEARYPGDLPEATLAEAKTAVEQANNVINSVLTNIIFPEV
jgi:HEPN domain-containing protein